MIYVIHRSTVNKSVVLEVFSYHESEVMVEDNLLIKKDTDRIQTFDSEKDAVDFMLQNFPKSLIHERYHRLESFDGEYYFK